MEDQLPILIQKQLNAEIERCPPLFPWETEVDEYDTTEARFGHPKLIPPLNPQPEGEVAGD